MKNYLDCKKIETAIKRAKKILTYRYVRNGLYENFGQNEVRKIRDKFIDLTDYSQNMKNNRFLLDIFDHWCQVYTIFGK